MGASAAVRAAVSLAATHGVISPDPVVLQDGSNVIVHLRPAPVVARIAARTALVRPSVADHLARDLAVSAFLSSRGVPVVTPSAELPPGPHLLMTASGPVWSDFEDTWLGPVAWDLACLAGAEGPEAAQRTVATYGGGAAPEDVEFHVQTRILFGTLWGVLMERT